MPAFVEESVVSTKLNFSVWLKTVKYIKKVWPMVLILLVCMLFQAFYDSSFIPSANLALMGYFESYGALITPSSMIWDVVLDFNILGIGFQISFLNYLILSIVLVVLRSFAMFGLFFSMAYIEMQIMVELRRDAFRRIQELSFSYFDKTPSGWLIARLQNDAASVGEVLSYSVLRIFQIVMNLTFTLITMFTQSWELALIILATTPLIFIIVLVFEYLILKYSRIARNAYSYFVGWLAESINGNKTIKTMAIEETIKEECQGITEDIRKKRLKTQRISGLFWPSVDFLSYLTTALIIIVFPLMGNVDNGVIINTSLLVLFIQFVAHIYSPIRQFAEIFSDLMASQASVEKIFMLIDTKPTLVDTPEVIEKYGDLFHNKKENFESLEGDIKFDHVSFSYLEGIEVLHDLNLHIEKGTSLAIVGETGSGKSTTVNLLCRFYEPSKGNILIDDINYKERSVGWLRSNIGYVQQTPFIFKGTIIDNIRYGKLDASEEDIIRVCKELDIHDFIMSLKDGYHTFLKDGGNELSQGQKQLISFARATIRDPKILILDEATSSIDTETEFNIQGSINKMLKGRTSLIIAHRLSTIVDASRILVMKDGIVVEDGNHKSLMEKKGYYYNLYMNQFKELNIDTQIDQYEEQIVKHNINL